MVVDLPSAVRPQQAEDLTALDLQVHAVDSSEHGFRLFLGEKLPLGGRGGIRRFVARSRPRREFFDKLFGFDCKISHGSSPY